MMAPALIAFGFVNPLLLAGLGLIALPIIIHWLARRRYRVQPWAAMQFLLEAERESRRRRHLAQWLLLALRCLVIALLALLVARPFFETRASAALLAGPQRTCHVIVLDDSASSQLRRGTTTVFQRLQTAATRLVDWISQSSGDSAIAVYRTSRPDEPLLTPKQLTAERLGPLRTMIEQLEPTTLRAAPARVMRTIAGQVAAGEQYDRTTIYVLSDFQRSDWIGDDASEAVFHPLRALDDRAPRILMLTADSTGRANISVQTLRLERPHALAGIPARLRTRVANHGARPIEKLVLQLSIDDQPLPAMPLPVIDPGDMAETVTELSFPAAGHVVVSGGLEAPDGFDLDDRYGLAVSVEDCLPVLVVNGAPDLDARRDEAYLLRRALAPPGPFASGVRPDVIDVERLSGTELDPWACVLLCNVGPLPDDTAARLRRYVESGGGLAFFLGDNAQDTAALNRTFGSAGHDLLPAVLTEIVDAPEGAQIGMVSAAAHPATAGFPDDSDALSEYVSFRRYARCRIDDDTSDATVLARFTDDRQTPALIERRIGDGRVALFASSADMEWNNWPASVDGSYVVALLDLVQYLSRRSESNGTLVCGDELAVALAPARYDPSVQFKPPTYPARPAVSGGAVNAGIIENGRILFRGPVADQLGTYKAELAPRVGGVETRPLCVNIDPRESDLRVATSEELEAMVEGLPHVIAPLDETLPDGSIEARGEIWRALVIAIVFMLMLEHLCAWWFGRARRSAPHRP